MAYQVHKKTNEFVKEMFANDFDMPKLGKGAGEDGYADLYRAWLGKLNRDFEYYSAEEVTLAADVLRRTRETRTFPMPSIIIDALKTARKELDNQKPQKLVLPARTKGFAERENLALDLIKSGIGRTAALEGWIGILFDFVYTNNRLPYDGFETNDCKREGRLFESTFAALVRGEAGGALREGLISLGQTMLDRREALRAYVIEGAPYKWGSKSS